MEKFTIIGVTPFERPDVRLAVALSKTKAFPVLHLGRDPQQAQQALEAMSQQCARNFGVCFTDTPLPGIILPDKVTLIIAPYGVTTPRAANAQLYYQVHSVAEAQQAMAEKAGGLIVKGNEGAGRVSGESSFILFQRIVNAVSGADIFVQGGAGIHTTAALTATGAAGVVLDSQLALFPECAAPAAVKSVCEKLNGNETRVIDGFRVLLRPNSPALPEKPARADLAPYLGPWELDKGLLPVGQDIAMAADLAQRYKKLDRLIFGLQEAMHGHLRQAKALQVISPGNALARELQITYPIAQGPMTRVSDVPAFAAAVADAGALPFVALSLLKGEKARELIRRTKALAGGKTWGVGILGFAPQELRDEQLAYIQEEKPPVVLIAGGRPSQAKPLEKQGIKTLLHVPSASLLDMYLKEGATGFVFEGRECGGHVGPLSSMVLWEKQVERLLQEDNAERLSVFFAGGIHDALSAAFISVMAAPLAARGVKVGVLMGTAYLYTKEAVETGAILQQFQDQAIAHTDTVLLETAPGHETRCLHSPFAGFFEQEKERLLAAGMDKKEIWARLEQLNVGRLRIASKGVERKGDELLRIDPATQLSNGMYMIGQVAALRNSITTMAELHRTVAEDNHRYITQAQLPPLPRESGKALNVAIVGMACIYPGAKNLEEYWRNILLGRDCVTEVPEERWNKALYYDPASGNGEKSPSKWGGFIPKIDFDPVAFGIPPQSLAAIDPTQLLSLLVAKQALEHAGYGNEHMNRENVSVIIGAEGGNDLANNYGFRALFRQLFGEMPAAVDAALPRLTEDSFPGVLANVIAGRITNRLDLGGRNYTVDAACASSLAAIDLACQELVLERADMVLAGGADLHNGINDYLMFASTHALSKKGKCMTFDAAADGIALGEGVAMVVLKRYEDAKRDGDTIYAVIQGVGGSSDGKSLGLTAPRKNGQVKALERAYEQAGISPAALGLVEAHGTGTVVGDRTELSALSEMLLRAGAVAAQTHLGSVKTQIGHTKCAAGLAGLIKAALAVYYGVKPPTIHLQTPNSYYDPATSPFAFNTEAGLWQEEKRIAGVSAFGFGGTNFHAVIENDTDNGNVQTPVLSAWPSELFVFRGDTPEEARRLLHTVSDMLESNDNLSLKDIAYSLYSYNNKPVQLSIVAADAADLLAKIASANTGRPAAGVYHAGKQEGKVAFLFPGQGSQRINMARDLFVAFPAMRRLLKGRKAYEQVLFPDAAFDNASLKQQKDRIRDTRLAQPLLGIVDLAVASFLRDLGMIPDVVAGHSYGELPALCFAGVFAEEELIPLSEKRAAAILDAIETDKGAMLALSCPEEELTRIIAEENDIYPVNHNSPQQWVVAGTTPAIARLADRLQAQGIYFQQLEVACAFHSPLLAGSRPLYKAAISDVPFSSPRLPVWSNTTAAPYPEEPEAIRERLAEHLVRPVRFSEEMQQLYAEGVRIFIEVGPGKVLSNLTKAIIGTEEGVWHTLDKDQHGITQLLTVIARYLSTGRALQLEPLFTGRQAQLLDLDNPAQYRKRSTVWLVNGQMAMPLQGPLPAHGAMPVVTPLQLGGSAMQPALTPHHNGAEQLVQEYLNNMKQLVQAQRDVLLGYLGHMPPPAEMAASRPAAATPPAAIPLPAPVTPAAAAQAFHRPEKDIKHLLMKVVSDKTGYPEEMLGMEMDLEADLSIDSIKRMEIIGALRMQMGGFRLNGHSEEALVEQLAAIKTLNGLVSWITENAAAAPATVPVAAPVIAPPAGARPSEKDIRSVLLAAVSEKTGYPPDMLGMDMDLEADLSIDSIKRMEIIGELKVKIGFSRANGREDAVVEQLAAIKTLNGLISWITESLAESFEPVKEAQKIIEEGFVKSAQHEKLSRYRFELSPAPVHTTDTATLSGRHLAIAGDNGPLAAAIQAMLETQGAAVTIVSSDDALQGYDGLLILDLQAASQRPDRATAFALLKQLDGASAAWAFVLTDTTQLQQQHGYAGFLKSLDKEWEYTRCRAIHLADALTPEQTAAITLQELAATDTPAEVYYRQGARYTLQQAPAPLAAAAAPRLQLNSSSVILVLGGAQGITAALMNRFAKDYPCHYVLVGRSADPRKEAQEPSAHLTSKEDIRQWLIAQGVIKKPAEIEQQAAALFKRNQVLHTINALEQQGATVSYHALDIRNEAELRGLLDNLYRQHGRIDGVVHGAGILEDKLFRDKTFDSFERVFTTKITPLQVLAAHLRPDTQFVALFSSVASAFGNRGQTDYAAANSVMDRYARELHQLGGTRVVAINWGPWKGAGMVSASLEKEYERRGISLIPLQAGMEAFVNELKYGNDSQVLIMAE